MHAARDGSWAADFGPFGRDVWFNCAHQGPLPRTAVVAAQRAIAWKTVPSRIGDADFTDVPTRLKSALGKLVGVPSEEVVLGNSASYGLNVLRNGIAWRKGDHVLSVANEFPATIYPWLGMQKQGVTVRLLNPRQDSLSPAELESEIRPTTRLVALSWVNSFNGNVLDVDAISSVCRARGVTFVLNGSQGLGAREIDWDRRRVDAFVACGYKWLCGPYATGFAWIRPELREQLAPTQGYWLPHVWGRDLSSFELRSDLGASQYDVFCPANFMNFLPWLASVEYLRGVGIRRIQKHNDDLVASLIQGAAGLGFDVMSPTSHESRSAIVVVSHPKRRRNRMIVDRLKRLWIHVGYRAGAVRFSPHLYNDSQQIERVLTVLKRWQR